MTSTDFKEFTLSDRIRIILRTGIYLNDIEYQNFKLHLYSISGFYVEVKIISISGDVESVRVISGEDVEKFLGDLALPESRYR